MATPATSSSTNPFRTPHLTPQNTNQPSPPPPVSVSSPAAPQQTPQATGESLSDVLTEDAPPAYTLAADPYQGEATVEYGPRRPFQQAPPPVVSPQSTGATGAVNSPPSLAEVFQPSRPPPPRHPTRHSPPPGRPPSSSATQLSSPTSSAQLSPPPQRFAPPPGQPPRRAVSSASTSRPSAAPVPDDGRPTTTPMPGHPLLRDGRLLVYPAGYTCSKCTNTGYKNYDPSHPCRKCWERHGRPYAGALVYAPTAAASSGSPGNFQRPLPTFRPPHAHARSSSASGPPGAVHRAHSQHPSAPHAQHTPHAQHAQHHPHPPPPPPPPPTAMWAHPFAPPPPGATVVHPGDPRIGGRLCWRCGGRGSVSFMIFDTETCEVCRGMGRVFN